MANEQHLKKLSEGVRAWNRWREQHPEILPDLRNADLQKRILTEIDFRHTNLTEANLCDTNLNSSLLNNASLFRTNLTGAKMRHAHLYRTCFNETILQHTNFYKALLLDTLFLDVDFSKAINLETIIHLGPSTIGIDTIQRSKANISSDFLLGAGISEQLLNCIQASGRTSFDYSTCFISYSSHDRHFVEILYQDLRKEGVMVWFAPESMKAGEKFPASITDAVQNREKVIVVISKHSLKSQWVKQEVMLARQREKKKQKDVLVPIRLDNAISNTTVDWAAAIHKNRHIKIFENWQQPSQYQRMFKNLLNDLHKKI